VRSRSPDSVVRDIGRRIAEIRAAKGWTQARFAEALGIAVQNVARMEQGRQEFRVKTLVRVAQRLGCDPADFWTRPSTVRPNRGRPRVTTDSASDMGRARKKR
jgi:transcriptional regulator with XRE-family HTH domain